MLPESSYYATVLGRLARTIRQRLGSARLLELPEESAALYKPVYSPWLDPAGFAREYESIRAFTLVDATRCWVLFSLARQALHLPGEFWECGVYRGGTARLLALVLSQDLRTLRLFDTFEGMPPTSPNRDWHRAGDFSDTSSQSVSNLVAYANAVYHKGRIPETFRNLDAMEIALAHVDVDLYQSVLDCCSFIYPRLLSGGSLVFDDYGWPTCAGAKAAVDEFFRDKPEVPLVLPTGQAIVTRLPHSEAPA